MGYAKFVVGALGGLGLIAVVACSDSSTPAAVTADQACANATAALCAKLSSCSSGLLINGQYGDEGTCVSRGKLGCVPALSAPGTSQTPALLDACAKTISGISCADIGANNPPDACKTKPGTVANGAACGIDAQCQSTACIDTGTTGCGTCAARIAAGGACGAKGQGPCEYGTTCIGSVCKKLGGAGAPCQAGGECAYGLVCNANACVAATAAGGACTPGTGDTCDRGQGFYCHPTKKQCIAVKQASVNAACGFDAGGEFTVCIGGAYCKAGAQPTSGVCTKLVADGGACTDKDPCQSPAQCINGICKIVDPSSCK